MVSPVWREDEEKRTRVGKEDRTNIALAAHYNQMPPTCRRMDVPSQSCRVFPDRLCSQKFNRTVYRKERERKKKRTTYKGLLPVLFLLAVRSQRNSGQMVN